MSVTPPPPPPGMYDDWEPRYDNLEHVDHPDHYNQHDIECIDVVELFNFNRGNGIKYVWRAGLKGDDAIQDLEKARWYIAREIQRLRKEQVQDEN